MKTGAVALVVILALPACGSERVKAAREARAPSTTAEDPFCSASRDLMAQLAAITATGGDGSRVADVYSGLDAFLRRAAGAAPPELRSDVVSVADTVSDFYRALAAVNFDRNRLPEVAWTRLSSPEFVSAAGRVADYSRRTCHG